MRVLCAFITLYLLGYLVFFTIADFDVKAWENAFFLWNNPGWGGVGTWAALYASGSASVKILTRPPLIFSSVMYCWEVVSMIANLDINNHWAVMVCFLALIGVTSYYFYLAQDKIFKYL